MRRFPISAFVLLAVLVSAPPAIGQEAEPLQKSDIIRLLTGTTYTKAEVAGIIRQSCLSFTPTQRDRTDFQALGADAAILSAIDGCRGGREPAAPALQLTMGRRIFDVTAGDTLRVPVTINRGSAGESGLRLRLLGSGAIRGGAGQDAVAFTDANGRATLVVPAGTAAASYNLTVDGDVAIGGSRAVTVRVGPAAPAQAVGVPDPVALESEDAVAPLRVGVHDRFGNPIPDVPVEVRVGSEDGPVLSSGRTSTSGEFEASISLSLLGSANRLVFLSSGMILGYGGVARPEAREAELAAVSGADQTAEAGQDLQLPLVVAVMDGSGAPAADVEVLFTAENGIVRPGMIHTDSRGEASTTVTMGTSGTETVVTAVVGDLVRTFTFQMTRGGMTVAAMQAALIQAAGLMEAGDFQGGRDLYAQVAAADPSNLAAATGVADTYAAEGQYEEAVARYRTVLRMEPSRRDAQVGMATASLGAGDPAEAARWFDLALSQDRSDVDSWIGLGDARARLDQGDEAREAYERALALDPGNEAARRGIARLSDNPLLLEADVWGGYTDDNGRDPGFRWAELRIFPGGGLEFWFAFDNMLSFRHPYLVRGQDDIEGMFGGIGYSYGANRAYRTSFEFGRREEPVDKTIQTTWTVDQTIGFTSGGWFKLGGWLGHWFDRDDWVVFAETGIPAGSAMVVKPMASYGDYFGSGLGGLPAGVPNRAPAKELRIGLVTRYEADSGFGVEPGVFYGNVDSDASEELSGSLWDASMRLWYAVSRTFAIDSFVQYQSPPGLPSFWRVGLGLRFGVKHPD